MVSSIGQLFCSAIVFRVKGGVAEPFLHLVVCLLLFVFFSMECVLKEETQEVGGGEESVDGSEETDYERHHHHHHHHHRRRRKEESSIQHIRIPMVNRKPVKFR